VLFYGARWSPEGRLSLGRAILKDWQKRSAPGVDSGKPHKKPDFFSQQFVPLPLHSLQALRIPQAHIHTQKHAHATMGITIGCKEDLSGKVAIVTGE
jgi:hypothetical protein